MRELTVKTKFLYVLPEAFSLAVPYTDRQRIVVAADEQVAAERQVRSRLAVHGESRPLPAGGDDDDAGEPASRSQAAVAAQRLQQGLHGLQDVGAGLKRGFDDRAMVALRRRLGILMIGRAEAGVLRFDQGHPLADVLYVGHPARPDLYYPAAEFHRRVFEHKFAEAVKLLTSLGASRIALTQVQGQARESEGGAVMQAGLTLGFARARGERSWSGAQFVAEFPGSGEPAVPDGLCWYPDEHTWQMIAHTRIEGGAERTSLEVRYLTDYGIDMQMVRAARTFGVKVGGKFQEHHDTVWQLDAEFPRLAS